MDCINSAILNGVFPDELKLVDVRYIFLWKDIYEKLNLFCETIF